MKLSTAIIHRACPIKSAGLQLLQTLQNLKILLFFKCKLLANEISAFFQSEDLNLSWQEEILQVSFKQIHPSYW